MTRRKLGGKPPFHPLERIIRNAPPFLRIPFIGGSVMLPFQCSSAEEQRMPVPLKRSYVSRLYHRRGTFNVQRNFIPGE